MKKNTMIGRMTLAAALAAVMLLGVSCGAKDEQKPAASGSAGTSASTSNGASSSNNDASSGEQPSKSEEPTQNGSGQAAFEGKNLFIGDSRTVGIQEYAGLEGVSFFANTGMSVFNIYKKTESVEGVGKVTLEQLLDKVQYDKIYIMLGINELGYSMNSIVKEYGKLMDYVKEKQPEAAIIVQANLYVTKERSDKDKNINNDAIRQLNANIQKLAEERNLYFLDANPLFDDGTGNMDKKKTGDSAHPYGKYYAQWGEWIAEETRKLLG